MLPKIIKHPKSVNVTVFETATLECVAQAFGLLNIMWNKVGCVLPVTAIVTEIKSTNEVISILRITRTVGFYSGEYYCVVENEAGKVNSSVANLFIQGT